MNSHMLDNRGPGSPWPSGSHCCKGFDLLEAHLRRVGTPVTDLRCSSPSDRHTQYTEDAHQDASD